MFFDPEEDRGKMKSRKIRNLPELIKKKEWDFCK